MLSCVVLYMLIIIFYKINEYRDFSFVLIVSCNGESLDYLSIIKFINLSQRLG